MTTLVHTSPLGDLDIPSVGIIPAGEPFDVPDDVAEQLLAQSDLYREHAPATPATGRKKKTPAAVTEAPTTEPGANEAPATDPTTPEGETK